MVSENAMPIGWKLTTVADLCELRRGASPRPISDPKYFGNGPGWVRISDVTKSTKFLTVTEQYLSSLGESKSVRVYPNEVIMSICATIGKPVIVRMDACIHDGFVVFKNLSPEVDNVFLLYWLQLKEPYFDSLGQHGTQKNLNTGLVKAAEIALPPLAEQRKIAAILTSVDDAIAATQRIIDATERVKRGLMHELLTRGIGHTEFKETEIGEIPAEWEITTLGDACTDSAFGPRFPAGQYDETGNYALLRTTDITDDWKINYASMPLAVLPPDKFESHRLRDGDLLITRSGTCGVVCIYEGYDYPVIPGAFLIRFRLGDKVLPSFVRYAMMTSSGQERIQAMAAGGVQKNLSGTNLKTFLFPLPSLNEQAEIVAVLDHVHQKIEFERRQTQQLMNLKQGLMQVLFTGKTRVNVDTPSEVTV